MSAAIDLDHPRPLTGTMDHQDLRALQAIALSVTEDGQIGTLHVAEQLHSGGEDVITLDVHGTIGA
jgi:hypothetical protein